MTTTQTSRRQRSPYADIPESLPAHSSHDILTSSICASIAFLCAWAAPTSWLAEALPSLLLERLSTETVIVAVYLLTTCFGFALSYGVLRFIVMARNATLCTLLAYHGWVHEPTSTKTKLWAFLLRIVKGRGPYSTTYFQKFLPKQPLPDLNKTLDRWLDVCKYRLTSDEYKETAEAVDLFRKTDGPKLQKFLLKKRKSSINWLSEYWLYAAYLSSREPLAIRSNYVMCCRSCKDVVSEPSHRAASLVDGCLKFAKCLFEERLQPLELNNLVPFCMSGYRYNFSSNRIPGKYIDELTNYKDSTHIVIIRFGVYYRLEVFKKIDRHLVPISFDELRVQLHRIYEMANVATETKGIASLTAQNRSVWHDHRHRLKLKNRQTLHAIESALFLLVLDDAKPKNNTEMTKRSLTGSGSNIWFDKCFSIIVYDDASTFGLNIEHSSIDAMVFNTVAEYILSKEDYSTVREFPDVKNFKIDSPERLIWNLEDMRDDIQTALTEYNKAIDEFDIICVNTKYGKNYVKSKKMSPDGYFQMCLQLAYWRLHKEIPKTYEPSTNRLYQLGRTETVHPGSKYSIQWMKCMDDLEVSSEEKLSLLRRAIKHQTQFRLDATVGEACDRHLLGLLCAARENGMDVPRIFTDKGWSSGFKLSSSQCPTKVYEYGYSIEVDGVVGSFGASDPDGYGVCYTCIGENLVSIAITSFHTSAFTSSKKLAFEIEKAFEDLKKLTSNN